MSSFTVNGVRVDLSNTRTDTPREIAQRLEQDHPGLDVDDLAAAIAARVGLDSIDAVVPKTTSFEGRFSLRAYGASTGSVLNARDTAFQQGLKPRMGSERRFGRGDGSPLGGGNSGTPDVGNRSPADVRRLQVEGNFLNSPGKHTVLSPVPGARSAELDRVFEAGATEPAYEDFAKAIYRSENIFLIPEEHRDAADRIAMAQFEEYIAPYASEGLTRENAVQWLSGDMLDGPVSDKMLDSDLENPWNTWSVQAYVDSVGEAKHGGYLPPGIVAVHEFMHIEEKQKGTPERKAIQHPLTEILTASDTIIRADAINKQVRGLSPTSEVDYDRSVEWGGRSIPLGRLANALRTLRDNNGGNLSAALLSPAGRALVTRGELP